MACGVFQTHHTHTHLKTLGHLASPATSTAKQTAKLRTAHASGDSTILRWSCKRERSISCPTRSMVLNGNVNTRASQVSAEVAGSLRKASPRRVGSDLYAANRVLSLWPCQLSDHLPLLAMCIFNCLQRLTTTASSGIRVVKKVIACSGLLKQVKQGETDSHVCIYTYIYTQMASPPPTTGTGLEITVHGDENTTC